MTIRFACPSCGSHLSADEHHAGKKGSCKKCGSQFIIPPAALPPEPPRASDSVPDSVPPKVLPLPVEPNGGHQAPVEEVGACAQGADADAKDATMSEGNPQKANKRNEPIFYISPTLWPTIRTWFMGLTRAQHMVMWTVLVIILSMCLFPPWLAVVNKKTRALELEYPPSYRSINVSMGYAFVFDTPGLSWDQVQKYDVEINRFRLFVQQMVVLIAGAGPFFLLRKKEPDPERP